MPTAGGTKAGAFPGRLFGAIVFALALLWVPPRGVEAAPALEFLYIDSTIDHAAGGHAAVRLGETVFHYQYYPGGFLLLVSDPWEGFRHRYNDLQNRSVTLNRVPLSREAYERVRSHFFTRFVRQEHHLASLDQRAEEQALLQRLATGEGTVALEGLGFFSAAANGDPNAEELKISVERRFGETWLQDARRDAAGALGRISFRDPAGWGVRLRELLAWREALVLLEEARSLDDDALLRAEGNGGLLTAREYAAGAEFRRELAESVLTLLASSRPDRGTALLLQMARFQALSRSLHTGVLATLDPFPDRAERLPPATAQWRERVDESRMGADRAELAAFREAFVAGNDLRGLLYSRIEAAQGRLSELERARRLGTPVRISEDHLLPCKSRTVRTDLPGTAEEFSQAARVAAEARDRGRMDAAEINRYNLFTRNCVTELVRDVNDSFESREQAQEQLGGALEPGERLSFIPFRLTGAVRAAFPSTETEFLPSYRLRRLESLYESGGPFVWLRENNSLTSTLYTPRLAEDGVFLFFTDDTVVPRPLLGALNLLYASAHAAGGLLLAPVDRGRLLARSLRGMLYSLPEIAFFNIRKGSFGRVVDARTAGP